MADLPAALRRFRSDLGVPAVGAAVVDNTGLLRLDVDGVRRRGSADRARVDDAWHIGSCAKSLTAGVFATFVQDGAATWDMPIGTAFPELAGEIDPAWMHPTVAEVLRCRSGMAANLTKADGIAAASDHRPLPDQRTDAVVRTLRRPPQRRGSFRYSNLGYVVVGAAIDRLAGSSYETALGERLLRPLGVVSSGFGPPPDIWGHGPASSIGPLLLGRGAPADPGTPGADNPPLLSSAGRLHLTIADWAKTITSFFANGPGALTPDTLERIFEAPAGRGTPMTMGWMPVRGRPGVAFGMQGSNTMWSASAMLADGHERAALVVANDGRTRVLRASAKLAVELLCEPD